MTTMTTPTTGLDGLRERAEKFLALADKATPGPWVPYLQQAKTPEEVIAFLTDAVKQNVAAGTFRGDIHGVGAGDMTLDLGWLIVAQTGCGPTSPDNAAFVAAAREATALIRALLTALSAAPQGAEGWRSIETAPKDGTAIIVSRFPATTAAPVNVVRWCRASTAVLAWRMHGCGPRRLRYQPTHWQPLPAPPSASPAPAQDAATGGEAPIDWWPHLRRIYDALPKRPRCRDCADEDGTCAQSGYPCDPTEEVIARLNTRTPSPDARELVESLKQHLAQMRGFVAVLSHENMRDVAVHLGTQIEAMNGLLVALTAAPEGRALTSPKRFAYQTDPEPRLTRDDIEAGKKADKERP